MGCNSSQSKRCDFAKERIEAETRAARNKKKEVTLQDIYDECDFSGITDMSNDKILETELRVEETVLMPVTKMQKYIKHLHNRKESVMFISDMYLPSYFLHYFY